LLNLDTDTIIAVSIMNLDSRACNKMLVWAAD